MAVATDILRSWVAPKEVVRDLAAVPRREGRVLSFLVLGCLMIFVANGPRLARRVQEGMPGADGQNADMLQAMTYSLFAWLILAPLILYGVAGLAQLLRRLISGSRDGYGTRLALFWAFLAASPAALLAGLVAGLIGPGIATQLTGLIWMLGLIWIAWQGLRAVSEQAE